MLDIDISWSRGRFTLTASARFSQQISGLCGASGSGKSTLLALIAGLKRPDSGSISLDGRLLVDTKTGLFVPPEKRNIGLVFQDAQLFPHMSVRENLLYGFRRRKADCRRFSLNKIVALLEVGALLDRSPRHLSGGEKQRIALGRALLFSPELLLLDEPMASLDEDRKQQILPFLLRVRDELGIPMIYVSHAMEEVRYLTSAVWRCEGGKIIAPAVSPDASAAV